MPDQRRELVSRIGRQHDGRLLAGLLRDALRPPLLSQLRATAKLASVCET